MTQAAQLLRNGEEFRHFNVLDADGKSRYGGVTWEHCLTIRHNHGAVEPRAARGLLSEVARPEPLPSCACGQACPVMLDLPDEDVTWHFLEAAITDIG